MITAVELRNWKTHKNTRMEFKRGINVVVGVMGAGKSSVMDAISFALFGTFPSLNHKRVSLGGLVTNRPKPEQDAEIKLEFSIGGSNYSVTRRVMPGSSTTSSLERDGVHLQTQSERVNEEIARILGIDYDTFSRVVYSEQNGLDYFLDIRKGERKRQIDEMLGLDKFAAAEENATALVNSIRSLIADEEQMLSNVDAAALDGQLRSLRLEREGLERELASVKSGEKGRSESVRSLMAVVDKLKADYSRKVSLSQEVTQIRGRVSALTEEINKIRALGIKEELFAKELAEAEANEQELSRKSASILSRERALVKAHSSIEAEIKGLRSKAAERDAIVSELSGRKEEEIKSGLEREQESLHAIEAKIGEAKSREADLSEALHNLEKSDGKCPVCDRDLDEQHRASLQREKEAAIARLKSDLAALEKESSASKSRIKEISAQAARVSMLASRLLEYRDLEKATAEKNRAISSARSELESAAAESKGVDAELSAARKSLESLRAKGEAISRMNGYAAKIKAEEEALARKGAELAALPVDEKTLYEKQELLRSESAALAELSSKLSSMDRYASSLAKQLADKEKEAQKLAAIKRAIERRRDQLSNMNKFKGALADTQAALRNRLVSSINGLMYALWGELYPYEDYSNLKLTARKDDYLLEANTSLDGGEEWVSVDSVASGGERSIASLTMRIALAMVVVPNLKWLILDEPTHNLDSNGISKMIAMLGDSLPKIVEQIFIITHDESMKQIVSAKVYQLDRDKASNGPTMATEA